MVIVEAYLDGYRGIKKEGTKLKKLSENQMKEIVAGDCSPTDLALLVLAGAGIGLFFMGIFSNPITATGAISANWLANAILGPAVTGTGLGAAIDNCIC